MKVVREEVDVMFKYHLSCPPCLRWYYTLKHLLVLGIGGKHQSTSMVFEVASNNLLDPLSLEPTTRSLCFLFV